jgi:hypothetical protein
MKNTVFILWLEGVNPELLSAVPSLTKLAQNGVDIRLTPTPLAEKDVCYYQTLTGMGSGKLGRFDAVRPEGYSAIRETSIPEGSLGRLLPDVLRSRKLAVTFLEAREHTTLETLAEGDYDCALVRYAGGQLNAATIDTLVQHSSELATSEGHLVVLTDVWHQEPGKFVNTNDFLADVGLLEVGEPRTRDGIVWPEALTYGLGTGQIWINLRGREKQGSVSSGQEYQEVREALINELRTNWRDPQTGELVVEQVLKKEDAYTGDYLFKAPDLIVIYRPGYAASPQSIMLDFDGASVSKARASSQALAPAARLIASGPRLAQGLTETAHLVDFMPSVMYLLNQPIPVHVDGTVILPMFTQSYRQQTAIQHTDDSDTSLSEEDEGLIVDRLRDLGYLG